MQRLGVDVGARARGEAVEEIVNELRLQVANHADLDLQVDHRVGTAAQVDGHDGEGFIHRHDEVTRAVDALAVTERLQHRLAENDSHVLDRVMLIDVQVTVALSVEIETAVTREQLQHVIEEADAGADVVAAAGRQWSGRQQSAFRWSADRTSWPGRALLIMPSPAPDLNRLGMARTDPRLPPGQSPP